MSNSNTFQIVVTAVDNASKNLSSARTSVDNLGSSAQKAGEKVKTELRQSLDTFTRTSQVSIDRVSDGLERVGATAATAAISIASVSGGLTKGFQDALRLIEDIDKALNRTLGAGLKEITDQFNEDMLSGLSQASQYSLTDILSPLKETVDISLGFDGARRGAATAAGQIKTSFVDAATAAGNAFDRAFLVLSANYQRGVGGLKRAGDSLSGFTFSFSGGGEALELFNSIKSSASQAVEAIGQGAQEVFYFSQAFDTLKGIVMGGPYELLIGQNVKLQEQLLATQSTLAATNQVLANGTKITDPTQAIQALKGPVEGAIAKIRQGSLELVNVTSKELIESFQIIAGEAGNIGFSLDEASQLTLSFGATLGTLGVPLFQARQEITSILQGTIDQNSIVAKSLGIQNQQIQSWRQQGTLVDNLLKKMEAFRAGNALAAKTLGGVTSNIQELIDNIGLQAGSQLLGPLVEQIDAVYQYLNVNKDTISNFVSEVVKNLFAAFQNVVQGLGAIFQVSQGTMVQTLSLIFGALADAANALGAALKVAAVIAAPFLNILEQMASAGQLINPLFQIGIQVKVLTLAVTAVTGAFGSFGRAIPFVGEALFLMELRSNNLIGLFAGLNKSAGVGLAGFLTLGANLQKIPGAFDLVASKIPVLGPQIAALIPSVSAGGIALLNLGKQFPQLSGFISTFSKTIAASAGASGAGIEAIGKGFSTLISGNIDGFKDVAGGLASIAENNKLLAPLAPTLKNFADNADIAAIANQKLAEAAALARAQIVKSLINFTAVGLIIGAAVLAINEFVLKNESLRNLLASIGNAIKSFGESVGRFLSTPIGIALLAVTGLTIAIKTGLAASVAQAVKSFAQFAALNSPKWISVAYQEIGKLSQGITNFTSTVGSGKINIAGILDGSNAIGKQAEIVKKEAADVTQNFREGTERFKSAIAERKAAIADLEEQIQASQQKKGLNINPFEPQVDIEGLERQKAQLEGEIEKLREARKKEAGNVGEKRQDSKRIEKEGARAVFADKARAEAEEIRQSLEDGRAQFEEEIARRKARLAELDELAAELKTKSESGEISQKKAQKDTSSIAQEKASIAQEIAEITSFREKELKKADDLERRSKKLSKPPIEFNLGDTVQKVQSGAAAIGAALQDIPGTFDKTKQGFKSIAENAGTAMEGLKARTQAAGTAIASGFATAKTAAAGFLATAGPILGLMAGLAIAVSAFNVISAIMDAGTKSTREYVKAVQEAIDRLNVLEEKRKNMPKLPGEKPDEKPGEVKGGESGGVNAKERLERRSKEISDSQNPLDKFLSGGLGALVGGGNSGADLQAIREAEAATNTLGEAEKSLQLFSTKQKEAQVAAEKRLAELQNARAAAAAKGDTSKVKEINVGIKDVEGEISERKGAVQGEIDRISNLTLFTKEQFDKRSKVVQGYYKLKNDLENLDGQAEIKGIELPDLGSAGSQLMSQVESALADLESGRGKKEDVEAKIKTTFSALQQLQKLGLLSESQAAAIYTRIASSSALGAEVQIEAQQGATQAVEQGAKERSDAIASEISRIEASAMKGEVSQSEAESRITQKKVEQINARLEAVRSAAAEEDRIRAEKLQKDLAAEDRKIGEARTRADEARKRLQANPDDKSARSDLESAEKDISAGEGKRASLQSAYENAVKESNQRIANSEADTQKELAQIQQQGIANRLNAQNTEIQNAVTKQQAEIEAAAAKGEITKSEATRKGAELRIKAAQAEARAISEALADPNLKGPERDKLEGQLAQKNAEIEKEIAAERNRQIESASKKALEVVKTAETERLIETQKLLNEGVISEEEANELRVKSNLDRVEQEIEIEKRKLVELQKNPKANEEEIKNSQQRILELTKSALEEERRLQDAQIAVITEKIERQAQVAENALKKQEIGLQKQLNMLNALNKALDLREKLLRASSELNTAKTNFETGQIDAIAATEKSEIRKRELSQITAQIKLQALEKEQAIAAQVFEIEQQRNKLALERKRIENEVAILRQKAEVVKGDARIKILEERVAAGRAKPEQLEAAKLEQELKRSELGLLQQEKGLIAQEKAMQPQLESMARQKFQFEQGSQRTKAQLEAFQTLSPGEQRAVRDQFQQQLLQGVAGGQFSSTDQLLDGALPGAKNAIEQAVTRPAKLSPDGFQPSSRSPSSPSAPSSSPGSFAPRRTTNEDGEKRNLTNAEDREMRVAKAREREEKRQKQLDLDLAAFDARSKETPSQREERMRGNKMGGSRVAKELADLEEAQSAGDRGKDGKRLSREEFLRGRGATEEQIQKALGKDKEDGKPKDKNKDGKQKDGKDGDKEGIEGKSVNFNISNSDVKFNIAEGKKEDKDGKPKDGKEDDRKLTPEERKEADKVLKKGLFGDKSKDEKEGKDDRELLSTKPVTARKQDERALAIAKPPDLNPTAGKNESSKPPEVKANFSITINAQDKDLGKRIQDEVRKGLDNVLKQAQRLR